MPRKRQPSPGSKDPEDAVQIRTLAVGYSHGYVIPPHSHEWGQLIYASQGVMSIQTANSWRVVPPRRAVWVPAGIEHQIEMSGAVSMRTIYLIPALSDSLPPECCVVNVSPLLRELILHAVRIGMLDETVPEHQRLIGVILDQLGTLDTVPLQLPIPGDRRALKVAQVLRNNPGTTLSLDRLAKEAGATRRTIERLFSSETGMSFGRWRQQVVLLHALRLLASGESVTGVALEVGYESTSAFIAMFKRALGTTPGRYYSNNHPK
jgi:AraC-like DNA-binding protein/quercetin dioxygenase-like cupin family protein